MSVERARKLRRTMSLPEVLLWKRLRGSDLHIRRQYPAGCYVTNFYCAAAKTVIEVDGESHDSTVERDNVRDAHIERTRDPTTWRISAREILRDPDEVADAILLRLRCKADDRSGE